MAPAWKSSFTIGSGSTISVGGAISLSPAAPDPRGYYQPGVHGIRGGTLAAELQQLYTERVLRPVEKVVIPSEEVDGYAAARYRVTTIVPLVDNPTRNTYILDQSELDSFLEGYEEYAEFIVGVERL